MFLVVIRNWTIFNVVNGTSTSLLRRLRIQVVTAIHRLTLLARVHIRGLGYGQIDLVPLESNAALSGSCFHLAPRAMIRPQI